MEGYNCIGCSPDNPFGLHLCFYEDGDDIVTTWKPSPLYQGWLNTLHGGIQALLLDEVCGWVVTRKLQTAGVTSKMETRYKRPVSTNDTELTVRAHIREQRRNIVIIDAPYPALTALCVQKPPAPISRYHARRQRKKCTLWLAKQKEKSEWLPMRDNQTNKQISK